MPINFNKQPYFDDFLADANYYRLLFRPGRAVQARELTQIQSMLQNQIKMFGDHVFKNGTLCAGGKIEYDRNSTKWIAVKGQDAHGNSVRVQDIIPGMRLRRSAEADSPYTNVKVLAKIVGVRKQELQDPNTIYIKYERGSEIGFGSNENLVIYETQSGKARYTVTTVDQSATTGSEQHQGNSAWFRVEPGVYYWNGHFIKTAGGGICLDKYTNTPTYRVGLVVSEEVITSDENSKDPASGSTNYGAPGADRYKITATLQKHGDGVVLPESVPDNFIPLATIDRGLLIRNESMQSDQTVYNIIGDHIAKRTYEESGNYVVRPYEIKIENHTTKDNPKLAVQLGEGKSYVKGYRQDLQGYTQTKLVTKGRDTVDVDNMDFSNRYGDNFVHIYDRASSGGTRHDEDANGIFVIGSGAGEFDPTSSDFGVRGEAVDIHSVPSKLVVDYGVTDDVDGHRWKSTLVGTARPMQMVYDKEASQASASQQRPGNVYRLWLDDFKPASFSNTVSVDNIKTGLTGAVSNTTYAVFTFATDTSHGITANDRISVTGGDSLWNHTQYKVHLANTTAFTIKSSHGASGTPTNLTAHRVTGNTSHLRTIVLNTSESSPAWNDSLVGAKISTVGTRTDADGNQVWGNNSARTIVGYIGTHRDGSTAPQQYKDKYNWSKDATVIVDQDWEVVPIQGDTYKITFDMKQARSIVHNVNKSATGVDQYPAAINQKWNIDPVSGVTSRTSEDSEKMTDGVFGNRVGGDCTYNEVASGDRLLFSTGNNPKFATKSVVKYGNLDRGQTSNTIMYYTEYSITAGDNSTDLVFTPAAEDQYKFWTRSVPYPYSDGSVTATEIKDNYIVVDETNGNVITDYISSGSLSGFELTLNRVSGDNWLSGHNYVLLYPAKAEFANPAYKKLITANTTHTLHIDAIAASIAGDHTNYDRGQVQIKNDAYGTLTNNSRISLGIPDVYKNPNATNFKVVQEFRSEHANTDLADTAKDVTENFRLDTGQRDMFYDNASLVLKAGSSPPTGNLMVCVDRFQRMTGPKSDSARTANTDTPGYFSIDSYQYTTDLTFDIPASISFSVHDLVTGDTSGATGYIESFANTGQAFAKARLVDVQGTFQVGENVTKGAATGRIKTIVEADLAYSDIPVYTDAAKVPYLLRNHIDMRPYVTSNTKVSDTIGGTMPLIPTGEAFSAGIKSGETVVGSSMASRISATNYAGRKLKISMTKDGSIGVINGAYSLDNTKLRPPKDDDNDDALTLFTLEIPPYTDNPRDVVVQRNTAMRYTMRDIGRLAKRVENLEYYVSLNALERATADIDVTFEDGTDRFKNGIITDNFTGDAVRDVRSSDLASVSNKGVLRPSSTYADRGRLMMDMDIASSPGSKVSAVRRFWLGGRLNGGNRRRFGMLAYTPEDFQSQPLATMSMSVNPFDLQNYTGTLDLSPDYDRWISTTKSPEYEVKIHGTSDSEFSMFTTIDENSNADEIVQALQSYDSLWEDIAGTLGMRDDDIQGEVVSFEQLEDGTYNKTTSARSITLGSVQDQRMSTAQIDAAIAQSGIIDGMTKKLEILPYIRSRDIYLHAKGLRPNHLAVTKFEDVGVEYAFSRANEIYMKFDNSKPNNLQFLPDQTGDYEKVKIYKAGAPTGLSANAILMTVREIETSGEHDPIARNNVRRGYIVPVIHNEDTGKVDYNTYKDGYYNSSWDNDEIKARGWQGTDTDLIVEGYESGAQAYLWGGGTHNYNGHYTGTARNAGANTTHLVLSPDASRYIAKNFGTTDADNHTSFTGIPRETLIRFVDGAGKYQECIANTIVNSESGSTGTGGCIVLELRKNSRGDTGVSASSVHGAINKDGPGTNPTVYSIRMEPIEPSVRSHGITQRGTQHSRSNFYGEKMGILHLPSDVRHEWTYGRKSVEVMDRYDRTENLITSYAQAYYFAEGTEQQTADSSKVLGVLQEVRSKLNAYRINNHAEDLGYVPGIDNFSENPREGKLAVIKSITVSTVEGANGQYTGSETFRPGRSTYGRVAETTVNELGNQYFMKSGAYFTAGAITDAFTEEGSEAVGWMWVPKINGGGEIVGWEKQVAQASDLREQPNRHTNSPTTATNPEGDV